MKRLLILAAVIALLIGLLAAIPAAGAAGDDGLVYKCQLMDGQLTGNEPR